MKLNFEKNVGITLIALVVTIVVVLILVGISISMLTGENGILKNVANARENSEISNEKEYIKLAYLNAKIDKETKLDDNLELKIQNELNTLLGNGKTTVIADDNIAVKFKESGRTYVLDTIQGDIKQTEMKIDENPGNIKVGINGESLKGNEDSPYEIWCIEDLVELSRNYTEYKNSYINLMQDLNFKSKLSYSNYKETKYGDINNDGKTNELIEELKNEEGFTPIQDFEGVLDGKNHTLYNLYINKNKENIAFIINNNGTIKNLSAKDGYIKGKQNVSTFAVYNNGLIENIENNSNVIAEQWNGGIAYSNTGTIKNVVYEGKIETTTKCTPDYQNGQRRNRRCKFWEYIKLQKQRKYRCRICNWWNCWCSIW